MKKVWTRVAIFLLVAYMMAVVDRINVGFAALTMNADLSFSPIVFGTGAGVFFAGYLVFEVPSVLLLRRFGARLWMACILVAWGCVTAALACVKTTGQFYLLRFLLGVAEAGLYPGVLYLLTLWFPSTHRARVTAGFVLGGPIALVIGAPVSGALLGMNGFHGLRGWQWLFMLDGALTVLWGLAALWWVDDGPATARWLTSHEKQSLQASRNAPNDAPYPIETPTLLHLLARGKIWLLIGVYFGVVAGLYGVVFWLPQVVDAFGFSHLETGFTIAVPYLLAAVAMVLLGRHSDRSGERHWHIAVPLLISAVALASTRFLHDPWSLMIAFCVVGMGTVATQALFWTLPTALLSDSAAPVGIALINSLSNLAGFLAPYLLGWIKLQTGNVMNGFVVLALFPLVSAILTLTMANRR